MKDVSQKREPKHFEKFQQTYLKEQISNWRVSITKLEIEGIKYFVNFASKKNSILNDNCQLIVSLQENGSYFFGYAFESDGFPYDKQSHPIFKQKISFNDLKDITGEGNYLYVDFSNDQKPWKIKFLKKNVAEEWRKLMYNLRSHRLQKAADIFLGQKQGKIDGTTAQSEQNEEHSLKEDNRIKLQEAPESPISPINIADVNQKDSDKSSEQGSYNFQTISNNLTGLVDKLNSTFSPRSNNRQRKYSKSQKDQFFSNGASRDEDREQDILDMKAERKQSLSVTSPGLQFFKEKVEKTEQPLATSSSRVSSQPFAMSSSRVSSSFDKPSYQQMQKANKDLMFRFIEKNNEIQELRQKIDILERQNEERALLRKESKEAKDDDLNEEIIKLRAQLKDQKKKDEEVKNIIKQLQQQKQKNQEMLRSMKKMEKKMVSLKLQECSTPQTFNVVLKNLQNNVNKKMETIKKLQKENEQLRQMAKHKRSRKMSWNELWIQQSKKIPEVPQPETPTIVKSVQDPQPATDNNGATNKMAMSAPN